MISKLLDLQEGQQNLQCLLILKITSVRGVRGNVFISLSDERIRMVYNKDPGQRQVLFGLSEGEKKTLSQHFLKFISTALGLRLLDVLRIRKRNSRALSCLKNVRDYGWTSQINI